MKGAAAITGAFIVLGVMLVAGGLGAGCSGRPVGDDDTGSVGLSLRLPTGATVNSVAYAISRGGVPLMNGTINVTGDAAKVTLLSRVPAATGYAVRLDAVDVAGTTSCGGTATFDVFAGQTVGVTVTLLCRESSASGVILVDGRFDHCPIIDSFTVSPLQANVGGTITLTATARDLDAADVLHFGWANSPAFGSYGQTFVTRGPSGFTATTTLFSSAAGATVATLTVSDGACTSTVQTALSFAAMGGPGGTGGGGGAGGGGGTSCLETNPPASHAASCQACLDVNVNPATDGCCVLAATDPEGFARCQAASACMREGLCNIGGDTATCLCGTNQAFCDQPGRANGPCVAQITAAAARNVITKTTDAPTAAQVIQRYGDSNFALGRAANIQAVAGAFCPVECAPELRGGGPVCLETNPPPSHAASCQMCLALNTDPLSDGCCPIAAADPTGFALCQAASACMREGAPPLGTCNIAGDVTSCYCGTNPGTCDQPGRANGPCVAQLTAAAGRNVITRTTDAPNPNQVLGRYGDASFAIGRAVNIHAFAGAVCPTECAPELSGGGTSGTGGGGGSGGAGGSGGGGTGGRGPDRIQVVAKCQDGTSGSVIGVTFKIYNLEASDKQWSDIKVRYYFTGDGTIPVVEFDYLANSTWNVDRSKLLVTTTSSYVELGFAPSAGTLFAFDNIAGSGDIQLRIHPADFHSTWNVSQADDHSFAACAGTAFSPRPNMPGTYLGQPAWGSSP